MPLSSRWIPYPINRVCRARGGRATKRAKVRVDDKELAGMEKAHGSLNGVDPCTPRTILSLCLLPKFHDTPINLDHKERWARADGRGQM